ncbi:YggS family pyridoxal phosphate-dependent enzyme [Nakamurella lactea]|uniref:YggS family pyridoxal phosphate-dependent enzyme n=1 Tax=Nakamurella lactea TaxID=459515 RepID=UPI000420CD4F|nr:YggS family pyridoxal phosphate-dependent enzyme [Nakamurella lactea]
MADDAGRDNPATADDAGRDNPATADDAGRDNPATADDAGAVLERLHRVAEQIAAAATDSGRRPDEVTILLATKTQPAERIAVALRAGFTRIGENRVQEITGKAAALQGIPHTTELIGHLQRNKVNAVLPHLDRLQSLDTVALAERLDRVLSGDQLPSPAPGRVLPVMVQVNVSGEASKFGVEPDRAPALLAAVAGLPHLRPVGLMTIGLNSQDLSAVRRGYALLRELRDRHLPGGELSMGMSGDFAAAIAEGATVVRLGSAVFGHRPSAAAR